ncbi:hypothetical protein B0H10DRAFT_1889863 [Mycena sp. CBHHK59/15]|nr:hypothetical protein B0H10DRAFT_1889863 [Mycena sp. CBHHK59/15]
MSELWIRRHHLGLSPVVTAVARSGYPVITNLLARDARVFFYSLPTRLYITSMDSGGNPPPKRSYTKTPAPLSIPTIPTAPSASVSSSYRTTSSHFTQTSLLPLSGDNELPFPHTQSRLRQPKQSAAQKMAEKFELMEDLLQKMPFQSLGEFFEILFHNRPHGEPDARGTTHGVMVGRFLHGVDKKRMSDILPLIYHHRNSYPSINSASSDEQDRMFSTTGAMDEIRNARPYTSTWATRLVAVEIRRRVGCLTKDDPNDPTHHVQLRSATNGRGPGHVVTWWDLGYWSLKKVEARYKRLGKGDLPMFVIEAASAPSFVNGVAVVRERRPHPIMQVSAMASFIISRNRYANGDLAMIMGIWHFVCKSHIDVKRCRWGC